MGWQQINSKIMRTGQDGGDAEVVSLGYLKGDGHEDGFFCFNLGPWHPYQPYISQEYSPHLEIDDTVFSLQDFTFNGKKVFASSGQYSQAEYVFWSTSVNAWVYLLGGGIREPYYWTDIDEETVLGDAFYIGSQNLPALNDSQVQNWALTGNNTTGDPATVEVALKHEYWEWVSNGNRQGMKPCGKYRNADDGSWKSVGTPAFRATNAVTQGAYYNNIDFYRDAKDTHDNWTFKSVGGLVIHYVPVDDKWVLGTMYQGEWSEGGEPTLSGSPVRYLGYRLSQDTGLPVRDEHGDFDLAWDRMDIGDTTREVLMGEASLWRRTSG